MLLKEPRCQKGGGRLEMMKVCKRVPPIFEIKYFHQMEISSILESWTSTARSNKSGQSANKINGLIRDQSARPAKDSRCSELAVVFNSNAVSGKQKEIS